MRLALVALTAVATLAVPALSSPASATCWLECKPFPYPKPEPTMVADPERSEAACGDTEAATAAATAAIVVPIGDPCPPKFTWTCCSPPGGPVCCTPPGGGSPICYGDGPDLPEPVDATFVDPETEACLAEVTDPTTSDEVLECRADELTPAVATLLVQLLSWLA